MKNLKPVLILRLVWILVCTTQSLPARTPTDERPHLPESRPSIYPLAFIENRGQWGGSVLFAARQRSMAVLLGRNGITLQLRTKELGAETTIHLTFLDSSDSVSLEGEKKQVGYHNFFIGSDTSKWRRRVPGYAGVLYTNLYDCVDLRVRESTGDAAGFVEYDLLLQAGADLGQVVVQCEGIESLERAPDGSLLLHTELGLLRQAPPVAWERLPSGKRRLLACRFRKIDRRKFGFEVPTYDSRHTLVIDPRLQWASFLGGAGWDECHGVALDDAGVVVVGLTDSLDFPSCADDRVVEDNCAGPFPAGDYDGFVIRMSPDGSEVLWSTYIGGTAVDWILSVAVNDGGEAIVTGLTTSADFPIPPGIRNDVFDAQFDGPVDAFILKLSDGGEEILYSTFVGGSSKDCATDIALYGDDAVCITGFTGSLDFPAGAVFQPQKKGTGDNLDSFVCILRPDSGSQQQLIYSTYLGGSGTEGRTDADSQWNRINSRGISADEEGIVTVVGATNSLDFWTTFDALQPGLAGGFDCYVTRIDPREQPARQIVYSTYLGGLDDDFAKAVGRGETSTIYVAGATFSDDFPVTLNAFRQTKTALPALARSNDGFLTIVDTKPRGGVPLVYSTFIGGEHYDGVQDMVVHERGVVTLAGNTWSGDCPGGLVPIQGEHANPGQSSDAFVLRLVPGLPAEQQLVWGRFLGGSGSEGCGGLAAMGHCDVVVVGRTTSGPLEQTPFPVTPGAFQQTYGRGEYDGFVARFDFCDGAFRRGDANADGGMDIADAIYILQNLFDGGPEIPCLDAADANDDEGVDIADAVYILQNLFANGPAIPPPHPDRGIDPAGDALGCVEYPAC